MIVCFAHPGTSTKNGFFQTGLFARSFLCVDDCNSPIDGVSWKRALGGWKAFGTFGGRRLPLGGAGQLAVCADRSEACRPPKYR